MLIAKEEPFEKSTPDAWRIAFPPKFNAPLGSLCTSQDSEIPKDMNTDPYTPPKTQEKCEKSKHTRSSQNSRMASQNYPAVVSEAKQATHPQARVHQPRVLRQQRRQTALDQKIRQ